MRTTMTLPPDLHDWIREVAHQERRTMSEVVVDLLRRGQAATLQRERPSSATERAFPTVTVGRPITADDVRSLDDD